MKKTSSLLLVLACVFASSSAHSQSSDKYKYLINATNAMNAVVSQSPALDRGELIKVTSQACTALSMLLGDKQFNADLFRMGERQYVSQQQRDQLKRELDLFISQFLRVEEAWLRSAGLEERAAKEILWSAGMFRMSIDSKFDPKQILITIDKLRSEVCDGSRRLQAEEDSAKRWALARKWSFRIGGVTMIAVDVGSSVVTGPVAAGSAAIGAAVAGWTE